MSRTLYAVVSNKRGVLYVGENKKERDKALTNEVGDEEKLSSYYFERGHDKLVMEEIIGKGKRHEFRGAGKIIVADESVIRALKGLL